MRKVIYTLANGTTVDSLTKAKMSDQKYTVSCETIPENRNVFLKNKNRPKI